jgi:hypothetical protein
MDASMGSGDLSQMLRKKGYGMKTSEMSAAITAMAKAREFISEKEHGARAIAVKQDLYVSILAMRQALNRQRASQKNAGIER